MPDVTNSLEKALALSALGWKVFPVQPTSAGEQAKRPYPKTRGFLEATNDHEQIATWFMADYPEALVGVWAGGSGLVVGDIDLDPDEGIDGYESIEQAARTDTLTPTKHYRTHRGGAHWVYRHPRAVGLPPTQNHDGMIGVDRRSGGSYFIWWSDSVPDSIDEVSDMPPDWLVSETASSGPKKSHAPAVATNHSGFKGAVSEWLGALPGASEPMPSSRVADFMANIPKGDFNHVEMVELVWQIVRLGAEGDTGIEVALERLRSEWLRGDYDTREYRRDFDLAVRGAIKKAGEPQRPMPSLMTPQEAIDLLPMDDTRMLTLTGDAMSSPPETRVAIFEHARALGLPAGAALTLVADSEAYRLGEVTIEQTWFSEGEPVYRDAEDGAEAEAEEAPEVPEAEEGDEHGVLRSVKGISFITDAERTHLAARPKWWGDEYTDWISSRLKDKYNGPYHRMMRWMVLSVILSPLGVIPTDEAQPMNCAIYGMALGGTSSGKTIAFRYGLRVIDAFYGTEKSPIAGETKKTTANALHNRLLDRDGEATMVYADEAQAWFEAWSKSKEWQGPLVGDLSNYYDGLVMPKLMQNDKQNSGKRGKALLTLYLTGIVDDTFAALDPKDWGNGFLVRMLWTLSDPIDTSAGKAKFEQTTTVAGFDAEPDRWAQEFKRVSAYQENRWGRGRFMLFEDDARDRMVEFKNMIDKRVESSSLWTSIYRPANERFWKSLMKCAALVALSEGSEFVTKDHVLIALDSGGEWYEALMIAIDETRLTQFDRECRGALEWIKRNAVNTKSKKRIQRAVVMREFKPNEIADRILRQLTEENRLIRDGDWYEVAE